MNSEHVSPSLPAKRELVRCVLWTLVTGGPLTLLGLMLVWSTAHSGGFVLLAPLIPLYVVGVLSGVEQPPSFWPIFWASQFLYYFAIVWLVRHLHRKRST
jgi:hypothetical protein